VATTKTAPTQGDTFTLTSPKGLGTGLGAVPSGTKVLVGGVNETVVAGMGGSEGVLFSWTPKNTVSPRTSHLPLAHFMSLFEKVGK
jgi:hypothetical protein